MLEEEGILPLPSLMEAWRPPTGGKRTLRGAYVRVRRGGSGRGGQARSAPLSQAGARAKLERIVRKASGEIVVYYFDAEMPGADVVDPMTGARIAPYAPSGVTRWMTDLHRSLLLGEGAGTSPVTVIVALLLVCGGIIIVNKPKKA